MKKLLEKLGKSYKRISLSKSEKAEIKSELLSFMEKNPVRNSWGERLSRRVSVFYNLTIENMKALILKPVASIVTALVLLTGGTVTAAEFSLPGDALYVVKVGVNEEVKGWVYFSQSGKARHDLDLAEERLREAETLALRERLTPELLTEIEARFAGHMSEAHDHLATVRGDENGNVAAAAAVSNEIETALRAHENLLVEISLKGKGEIDRERLEELAEKIREALEDRAEVRVELKLKAEEEDRNESGFENAAEGRMKAAENKLEEVTKYIEKKEDREDVTVESLAAAKAKLKVASDLLAEGRADFEAEEFERAYGKFVASFKASQEAKAEIKVREDVDVRIEVDGGVGIGIGVGRDKDDDDDRDEDEDEEDEEKSKDKDSDEDKDNGQGNDDKEDKEERDRDDDERDEDVAEDEKDSDEDKDKGEGNDDKEEAKLKIKIDAEADEDGDVDLKIDEKLKIK